MSNNLSTLNLVLTASGSVFLLLFLVMKARMHAFVALMIVSAGAGIFSGMPLNKIVETMQKGMGSTLGFLSIVVALGAMFGKILHETGALDQIAKKLLTVFGEKNAHFALGLSALVCALPLFFDVAIVLLIGIVFAVARRTDGNLVKLAVPLFAGVAASAAFLLPGPTPTLVADQLGADFGWMIIIGLTAAIPSMLLGGPLFGSLASKFTYIPLQEEHKQEIFNRENLPSFSFSLAFILFPLFLVGLKTLGTRYVDEGTDLYELLNFIGHPFIALISACLLAFYGLALPRGMDKEQIMTICSSAITPAGIILLVTGAGGVFKQVLVDSGVGPALGQFIVNSGLPIALACFVLAATVRVIQGSAMVSCLTTIALVKPILETMTISPAQMASLAVCISGGAIVLSHVNDSGFWLFGKFTGATEAQTLKTWTIMETIIGSTGAVVGMIYFSVLSS